MLGLMLGFLPEVQDMGLPAEIPELDKVLGLLAEMQDMEDPAEMPDALCHRVRRLKVSYQSKSACQSRKRATRLPVRGGWVAPGNALGWCPS